MISNKQRFEEIAAKVAPYTLIDAGRLWNIYQLAQQAARVPGDFIECGVYKGGSAAVIMHAADFEKWNLSHWLFLFDTFSGMPESNPSIDRHKKGDFRDTDKILVHKNLTNLIPDAVHYSLIDGEIPGTFGAFKSKVAFAHLDLDLYQSTLDALTFVYPRLNPGGIIVLDDYNRETCPGVNKAVDEFFADRLEVPFILPQMQAVITKLPEVR